MFYISIDCGEYIKMEIDDMDYNEHVRPNTNVTISDVN